MADPSEIDRAFDEGRRVGRLERIFEGLPKTSILPGASFSFRRSLFDSFVAYERDVFVNLRAVQAQRWLERRRSPGPRESSDGELAKAETEIGTELRKVREAVDAELAAGHGRACIRDAMRASPQVPASVVGYRTAEEYVGGDPNRLSYLSDAHIVLAGADFGGRWSLEDVFRRWEATTWRISWIAESSEVYAEESRSRDRGGGGRVWLLGRLQTRESVDLALDEMIWCGADRERNSLVVAAREVARVGEQGLPPPDADR
ncbi:MAG: hypothetical protein R2725_03365 [Solirubrobacterales bacterium]